MSSAWAFALVYNEAPLIAYWVRHYLTFCARAVLFVDVDTTDGTAEIARAEGADVRSWDGQGIGLDDELFARFASGAYKEAVGQTDWVIWVDADELLYHPSMQARLDTALELDVTFPTTDYYVMVSDHVPEHDGQIYDDPDFQKGIYVQRNAKTMIFNPNLVTVTWEVGKHGALAVGTVTEDNGEDPLLALHYRWLGADYLKARDAKNYARLSHRNRAAGHGLHVHPGYNGPYTDRWAGPDPASATQILKGLVDPGQS